MKNDKDIELWDYHQTDNAAHLVPGHIRQEMLRNKINKYVKGGKLLEIGFGDGYLLSRLSEKYECSGADISGENIKSVMGNLKNVLLKLVGVDGKLPFNNNYFDAFVASEVLEHMNDEELIIAISEIKRILKPGGKVFITIPAEENLKLNECFCPSCGLKFHKWGHKQYWDKNRIEEIFKEFRIIKISEYYNRFVGSNPFENLMGRIMQFIQTILNYLMKFPNKIYRNRIFVVILENKNQSD